MSLIGRIVLIAVGLVLIVGLPLSLYKAYIKPYWEAVEKTVLKLILQVFIVIGSLTFGIYMVTTGVSSKNEWSRQKEIEVASKATVHFPASKGSVATTSKPNKRDSERFILRACLGLGLMISSAIAMHSGHPILAVCMTLCTVGLVYFEDIKEAWMEGWKEEPSYGLNRKRRPMPEKKELNKPEKEELNESE